jgi:hypothetical protein
MVPFLTTILYLDSIAVFVGFVNELNHKLTFSANGFDDLELVPSELALPLDFGVLILVDFLGKIDCSSLFWNICPAFVRFVHQHQHDLWNVKLTVEFFEVIELNLGLYHHFIGFELVEELSSNGIIQVLSNLVVGSKTVRFRIIDIGATFLLLLFKQINRRIKACQNLDGFVEACLGIFS